MTRLTRTLAALFALSLALAAGCSPATETDEPVDTGEAEGEAAVGLETLEVVFGTLATEDSLPFWVAESEGLFDEYALDVTIETFQAAAERDVAMTAGSIDAMMGDIIATALLEKGGYPVSITTVMLGAQPAEGRFGIVTKPDSDLATLEDLAGVPVGTSLGTIQEYVVDSLFAEADVTDVVKESVPKVPIRFELLSEGRLEAAALPEPLLSLAEFGGGTILADDTEGDNITQTVLIAADEWLQTPEGAEAMERLLDVWDEAVEIINADPDAWRDMLVEKARLPEPLAETYAVNSYPRAQKPEPAAVQAVVDWMKATDLIDGNVPYRKLVWEG